MPCAIAAIVTAAPAHMVRAQQGQSPVAPSSTIGPVTDQSTLSLLGLATLPEGNQLARRNDVWFGATQPLGSAAGVRLSMIGSGNWQVRDALGESNAMEGTVALRARGRVGGVRGWSAVSYGHASLSGAPGATLLERGGIMGPGGLDAVRADTTVSRRVDIGNIGRAEAGVLTSAGGFEFSFGVSVERATRVTTQTLVIDVGEEVPALPSAPGPSAERASTIRTMRGVQRRDVATGIAAMGFNMGAASWLVTVTSPVVSNFSSDALSPRPRTAPTVASLAVVQPIAGWLSLVGAASTNSTTVGSTVLRDDVAERRSSFAPVVALGVRISRLPFGGRNDLTPNGILSLETHTIGAVDSASLETPASSTTPAAAHDEESDTLRVLLVIDAPRAESVELMGDATGWLVTGMQRMRNGRWRAELRLSPGAHRITVRADGGKWAAPPGLPVGNDDFGTPVGMIIIQGRR